MNHIVHYRLSDGEIIAQHISSCAQPTPANCGALTIAGSAGVISHQLYCVDLESQTVVAKNADQLAAIRAGALEQHVRSSIAAELLRTDCTQLPDYPITPEMRAAWTTYRQALRDLSKWGYSGDQQMTAWPVSPDGRSAPIFAPDVPKPARPAPTVSLDLPPSA